MMLFVVEKKVRKRGERRNFIRITEYEEGKKYVDNSFLQVGFREKSKPYSGEMDEEGRMDIRFKSEWLDAIEEQWRDYEEGNKNKSFKRNGESGARREAISRSDKRIIGERPDKRE